MSDNPPSSGKLYLVPTPIGNLEDISLRALRILRECDLLLAEDTRQTYILLQKYDIKKPIQSHHAHNELHNFLSRLAGTVAMTLVPVALIVFLTMPASLHHHIGTPLATADAGPSLPYDSAVGVRNRT